ncbi:MAG: DUF2254 domain-containing protein [Erythrobacter sp.]|jgi:uncharacterized membrane protein|nr:DUF2254 domain-containing protein [Erythrobacter sp.]
MTAQIRFFWARLNANYWFYPAVFALIAGALAFGTVWLDRAGAAEYLNDVDWLVPVEPQGASDILSVMASSMIAVASTVFSITLVAVTYASGTYGPRLLTNFLEDRGNQLSLATFIATFVYALIVLRSVRAGDEGAAETLNAVQAFTPQLSLLIAYLLMGVSVGVLVFFLNHVPTSIRINKVLEQIGQRLIGTIRDTYPVEDEFRDARESEGGETLAARQTGYVQLIDFAELESVARECGAVVSLRVRTGDFVHRSLPLLDVKGAAPGDLQERLRECFTLGPTRTPEQDPQFLIDELVEIGLRALSPGINDPFTAITALHWLGAAISEIARRDLRKDVCDEDSDDCPVIPCPDGFRHYAERSFGSIRSAVAASPNAARVMIDTLEKAALPLSHRPRIEVLRDHARMLVEQARLALVGPDLKMVEDRYRDFDAATSA